MASLTDIAARRARRLGPQGALEATVADAPGSVDDFLRVVVDSQPGRVRECPWMPRGDTLPFKGDAALVIESDAGVIWVIAWWPNTPS